MIRSIGKEMNHFKDKGKLGRWLLVIVWMIIIFLFSAQPATASNDLSLNIIDQLFSFIGLSLNSNIELLNTINLIIRKGAHLFVYLILGGLITNALWPYRLPKASLLKLSCIIGLSYATIDEFHQLFVDGRSGQISDVFLDSLGVIIGVWLVSSLLYSRNSLIKRD